MSTSASHGITAYHGSHSSLANFIPRQVVDVDTLGTWFTSKPEYAGHYGPQVHSVTLPMDGWHLVPVEADKPVDFFRVFAADIDAAMASGHGAEAKVISRMLPDYNLPSRFERMLASDEYEIRMAAEKLVKTVKLVRKSNEAARTLLNSASYMQLVRAKFQAIGRNGIAFLGCRIDLRAARRATRRVRRISFRADPGRDDAVTAAILDQPQTIIPLYA